MSLIATLQGLAGRVSYKEASTGSKGFFVTDKIAVGNTLCQTQVSAWVVGSKSDPAVKVEATPDQARAALTQFVQGVAPKTFSNGKEGHYRSGKVAIEGQIYQAAVQVVPIG